jgi:hypothetical protein
MQRLTAVAAVLAVAALVGVARADDNPNPAGTWKWTIDINGQKMDRSLKLKLDGDKLTGTYLGRDDKETPIEDATFKDGQVSFKVTLDRNGQKFTINYNGKVSGDTITGKTEFERNGEKQSRDWEAKRAKD